MTSLRNHGPAIVRTKGTNLARGFEFYNTGASQLGGQTSTCVPVSPATGEYSTIAICRSAKLPDVPGNDADNSNS